MDENINSNKTSDAPIVDRAVIKELRKERKKQKKLAKQEERQRNREKQFFSSKNPTDSRIQIISHDCLKTSKTVSNTVQLKTVSDQSTSKRCKNQIEISLSDALSSNKPVRSLEKNFASKQLKKEVYSGNMLDSNHPERKVGKHRINEIKKLSKLKKNILENKEMNTMDSTIKYYSYCSEKLDDLVKQLLTKLVGYQERQYKKDSIKGKAKQRYIVGLKQVSNLIPTSKLKLIIIPTNLPIFSETDALYQTIKEIQEAARIRNIPYVFSLSRRTIGRLVLKYLPTSCVGIINPDGALEEFVQIVDIFKNCINNDLISKMHGDDYLEELTTNFINVLTSM